MFSLAFYFICSLLNITNEWVIEKVESLSTFIISLGKIGIGLLRKLQSGYKHLCTRYLMFKMNLGLDGIEIWTIVFTLSNG
jgi:hypothetical protein